MLGQVTSVSGFLVLGSIFLPTVAPMVGFDVGLLPRAALYFAENQLHGFVAYMALNMLSQKLVATGAYEIRLGGKLIFSALERGGVPSVAHIADLLAAEGLRPAPGALRRQ